MFRRFLIDREKLAEAQAVNDPILAHLTLKEAFTTDVSPILAAARERNGGAIDPLRCIESAGIGHKRQRNGLRERVVSAGII